MSKRKRDAPEQAEPLVKIDSVIDRILAETSKWVDPCGCAYTPEHRVTRERDAAALKVGFFDSLTCRQICDVVDLRLPGDYTIPDVTVDLNRRTIAFRIQRLRRDPPDRANASGADGGGDHSSAVDLMKLRISYSIAAEDVSNVHAAISTLSKHLPGATFKVSAKPATYSLVFTCKDAVSTGAITYSAALRGVIDFDHSQLVVDVDKAKPDILG